MKKITVILLLACAFHCAQAQIPSSINTSRWAFPGVPNVAGLVLTADYKAPKKAWYTERDSHKVGSFVFPKKCVPGVTTEYLISPITPTRITFAEKAPTFHGPELKPKNYKPQVWFNDINFPQGSITGYDSLFALIEPAKGTTTGTLISIPTGSTSFTPGAPFSLQWAPAAKKIPAAVWFIAYTNTSGNPSSKLYSFVPVTKGTAAFQGTITRYAPVSSDADLAIALKVENGLVWTYMYSISGNSYLQMMPLDGTTGLRWTLPSAGSPVLPSITVVYNTRKPKPGILPNEVILNGFTASTIIALNASVEPTAVDTVCVQQNSGSYSTGFFSDNASKADTGKKVIETLENVSSGTPTSFVAFLHHGVAQTVTRTSVSFTTATQTVNGFMRSVPTNTKTLPVSCGTSAGTFTHSGCSASEWDVPVNGDVLSMNISTMLETSIHGMSDAKKFDLVFNQQGSSSGLGPNSVFDAAITRIYGKYVKSAAMQATMEPDLSFTDEALEPPDEFALDNAYPNPFNPTTTIRFTLPAEVNVTLTVYNILGQEVSRLVDGAIMDAGEHEIEFNASDLPSGVYIYRINAGAFTDTKRIMLIK